MQGYQLKITIKGTHPPIWRRVLVPEHISFYDLDDVIEECFGWTHEHLFGFYIEGECFEGEPVRGKDDSAQECIDGWLYEGLKFAYTYDFGDDWEHEIKVEKIVPYDKRCPEVLKYKGPNMIEDCGGLWGFYDCIDEAEPFDIEEINELFATWELAEVTGRQKSRRFSEYSEQHAMDEAAMYDEFLKQLQLMEKDLQQRDIEVKKLAPQVNKLKDLYMAYPKEEIKKIAKIHKFTGYSKFGKEDLATWLANKVLDEHYIRWIFSEASQEEVQLVEELMANGGGTVDFEFYWHSKLLISYGGYIKNLGCWIIPEDAQHAIEQVIGATAFQNAKTEMDNLRNGCMAAVYLYGAVTTSEMQDIMAHYGENYSVDDIRKQMAWIARNEEMYALDFDMLMDEDLLEGKFVTWLRERQQEYERYYPETLEEFLEYGYTDCQMPNEHTQCVMDSIENVLNIRFPGSMEIFYNMQDAVRMNANDMEIVEMLSYHMDVLHSQKQRDAIMDGLKVLRLYTRHWEYNGHYLREVKPGIPLRVGKKIFPNEKCPCGSGKKYKHCCGR